MVEIIKNNSVMSNKKILVVCQYYYPEPFRVTDICEELVKQGNQVTVLTGLPNYPEGKVPKEYRFKSHRDEFINGVRVIRCYEHGRGNNSIHLFLNYFSFAIAGIFKSRHLADDFDYVFVNQLSPVMMSWPALSYARRNNKKVILYSYDLWPASLVAGGIKRDSMVYKFFLNISKHIYCSANQLLVTSKSFSSYFAKEFGIDEEKIKYLPQYCESLYETISCTCNESCNRNKNFVFAGNIGAMQSVETIIKAANEIKGKADIVFHIVGDGRDLDNCKALAQKYNLNNIVFYGRKPLEEMPSYYSIADAMIVTLAKDDLVSQTLPGKVQSYMAAGKPIIAAIDGEANMIIKDSQGDYCCDSEDYVELSKLIIRASKSNDLVEIGKRNRQYYEDHFSKRCFFDTLNEILSI